MARSTIGRVIQVGKETTAGTAVSAGKLLSSLRFKVGRGGFARSEERGFSYNIPSSSVITTDHAVIPLEESVLTYTDATYAVAMTVGAPTIATPGGGTNSRSHTYTVAYTGEITPQTLTIQDGDSTACLQAAYGFLKGFTINLVADGRSTISGTGFGRIPTGTTLTGTPTAITGIPVSPRHIDVYMDDTGGTIGTTKIAEADSVSFTTGDIHADPRYVLNTTYTSFESSVSQGFKPMATIKSAYNSAMRTAYLAATASTDVTKLVRIKATGAIIEGSIPYSLTIDFAGKLTPKETDVSGAVYAVNLDIEGVVDTTFGKAFEIVLVNTLTAL